MLKLYDYLEVILEEHYSRSWFFDSSLKYYASDIMEKLNIKDDDDKALALTRTFQAFDSLQIPLNRNFKKVYCFDGKNLILDWKISTLACYMIVVNCNPSHEGVAKAQLYFAMKQSPLK